MRYIKSRTSLVMLSSCDVIADMLLSGLVQRFQELVKLFLRLATERRQQLLDLLQRQHLRVDGLHLFLAEYLGLVKFFDKSGMLCVESFHQEHVIFADGCRVDNFLIKT